MNRNHQYTNQNHYLNHLRPSNNLEGMTQSDAVSPRFRNDRNNDPIINFCYTCKTEFSVRNIHDLMEHYSKPHESDLKCLYCKKGNVHQYKNEKGMIKYYHDCYRSKMGYDK